MRLFYCYDFVLLSSSRLFEFFVLDLYVVLEFCVLLFISVRLIVGLLWTFWWITFVFYFILYSYVAYKLLIWLEFYLLLLFCSLICVVMSFFYVFFFFRVCSVRYILLCSRFYYIKIVMWIIFFRWYNLIL